VGHGVLGAVAAIVGGWLAGIIIPDNRGFPWIGAVIVGVALVLIVRWWRGRQAA